MISHYPILLMIPPNSGLHHQSEFRRQTIFDQLIFFLFQTFSQKNVIYIGIEEARQETLNSRLHYKYIMLNVEG